MSEARFPVPVTDSHGMEVAGYHQARLAEGGEALAAVVADSDVAPDSDLAPDNLETLLGLDEVHAAVGVALD